MKTLLPFGAIAFLLLSGCATKPIEYYYGGYSKAYYHNKKDGTPASVARYKKALEDIIAESQKRHLRPPPGIYLEYGYLLAKEHSPECRKYFDLEVQTYPESAKLVALVESQLQPL